ncbi:SMI1/KNR4 family protein [Pendulispora brunnea]|uniref:SMI1/KNR4 family protein n=1 Tax=Pendulispora brunnea TaxID=2905690 RepID=A0ABZ2K1D5_9BACT
MIEEFIAYASAYNPVFAASIRGATPLQLAELERLVGRPLPAYYKEFLSRMGQDDVGLSAAEDATMAVDGIIDYYRNYIVPGERTIPPNCIVIGAYSQVMDVSLHCVGDDEPRVYFTEDHLYQPWADSLEKLLFRTAFQKFRGRQFSHELNIGPEKDLGRRRLLASASELAERLGFQRERFSDSVAFCGEHKVGAVQILQTDDAPIGIRLYGNNLNELEPIAAKFGAELGLITPADRGSRSR